MAITNYTELQAAAAGWINKTNLTAKIPDFITLAESHFNKRLRLKDQETIAAFTATGQYTALPADFLEMRNVRYAGNPTSPMEVAPPEILARVNYGGTPRYYSVSGNNLELFPFGEADLTLNYWAKIPDLATNSTNFLLTANPDVYLWRTLYEAATYLKDAGGMQVYQLRYQGAVDDLLSAEKAHRHGGPMQVRAR